MRSISRSWFVGLALMLFATAAHCGGEEVPLGSRTQALSDGGGDGGPAPVPRLQVRKLVYNGVVVADAGGLYDNDLGAPCHPEVTTEGKLRCIPDGDDMEGLKPAAPMFVDPSCSTMVIYQSHDACPTLALSGRHVLLRAPQPTASCAPTRPRLARVYRITTKLTSPIVSIYILDGTGMCIARTLPLSVFASIDLYQTQAVALSALAELTEMH